MVCNTSNNNNSENPMLLSSVAEGDEEKEKLRRSRRVREKGFLDCDNELYLIERNGREASERRAREREREVRETIETAAT